MNSKKPHDEHDKYLKRIGQLESGKAESTYNDLLVFKFTALKKR